MKATEVQAIHLRAVIPHPEGKGPGARFDPRVLGRSVGHVPQVVGREACWCAWHASWHQETLRRQRMSPDERVQGFLRTVFGGVS